MRTIKFLIVYLFLTTNLISAEIEILVDKPGEGKKLLIIPGYKLNILVHLLMEKFLILTLEKTDL